MNKKSRFSGIIIFFAITILFLSGCTPQRQATESSPQATALPLPTTSPTSKATEINIQGYQPITPDNIRDMELLYELGTGKPYDVTLSPDGKTIAALTKYEIILYDRETFQEKFSFPTHFPDYRTPSYITYSPDGKQIIYVLDSLIYFVDAESGTYIDAIWLDREYRQIKEIQFTPNLDRLIIKGTVYSPPCQDSAINYAIYTFDHNKLFDHQVCEFLTRYIHKPVDGNRTLFIAIGGYIIEVPFEMYLVDNTTGNTLAGLYKRRESIDDPTITTTFGNTSLLPSDEQVAAWAEEEYNKLHINQPDGCFSEEKYMYLYKILDKDESSMLFVLKDGADTYLGRDILVSEINLTTCETKREPLLVSDSYRQGTFSPDGRHFAFSNMHQINILNLEEDTAFHFESSEYLEMNKIEYAYNTDGTRLLLYFDPDATQPGYDEITASSILILDANTGKTIGSLAIPEKTELSIAPTSNPKIMMISYLDRVTLWNIETEQYLADIPDGDYLFYSSRDAVWIVYPAAKELYAISLYNLSDGRLINNFQYLKSFDPPTIALIENNAVLKINYWNGSATYIEMELDIDNNIVLSEIEEVKKSSGHEENTSEYSDWKLVKNNDYFIPNIFFQDNKGYKTEYTQTDFDSIRIAGSHEFWNMETGEFIGMLDADFSIDELFFSPNQYYLAAIGSDGIIRIFGVKDK